jgi:transcriptional activator SPT7
MHALDLNGVQDLDRLDVYIKDDIERYGTKLEDCHRRLKRFLTELLVLFLEFRSDL